MADMQLKPGTPESACVFNRTIALGNREQLTRRLLESMAESPTSAFFCNVHMLMLSQESPDLAKAMDSAGRVFPDGVPLAWLQRWLGCPDADVLRGYEAVQAVCAHAASTGDCVGFLGSTEDVLQALRQNLQQQHPGLCVRFLYAPPAIREGAAVEPALVEQINSHRLFCLFIGLGCPKQELWAAAYAPHLNCSLLAVGAAFDWLAGTTNMPPLWMQNSGLGWLHRLLQNPRRMWPRSMKYNGKYVYESAKLVYSTRLGRSRGYEASQ